MKPPNSDDTTFTITGRVTGKDRLSSGPSTTWHPSTDDGGASEPNDGHGNTTRGRSPSGEQVTPEDFPISEAIYRRVADALQAAKSRIASLEKELRRKAAVVETSTEYNKELTELKSGLSSVDGVLFTTCKTENAYNKAYKSSKARIDELRGSLKSEREENARLRTELERKTQRISELDNELEMLRDFLKSKEFSKQQKGSRSSRSILQAPGTKNNTSSGGFD